MADEQPPPGEDPRTIQERIEGAEGFGCFILVLVGILVWGMHHIFEAAGPGGSLGAGIASAGLALMGFGIVWVAARYRP